MSDKAFHEFWKENWPGLCPTQIALACWRESARQARAENKLFAKSNRPHGAREKMITSSQYAKLISNLRETNSRTKLHPAKPEPTPVPPLDNSPSSEIRCVARPMVSIRMRRCWILDRDNAWGAIKSLLDGLQKAGLIPGDREDQIELEVIQEKVNHRYQQGTTIELEYETSTPISIDYPESA